MDLFGVAKDMHTCEESCYLQSRLGIARCILKVKVKATHTRYRALGPELIPMYRQ